MKTPPADQRQPQRRTGPVQSARACLCWTMDGGETPSTNTACATSPPSRSRTLTRNVFAAFTTPAEQRTPAQQAVVAYSDSLIEEFARRRHDRHRPADVQLRRAIAVESLDRPHRPCRGHVPLHRERAGRAADRQEGLHPRRPRRPVRRHASRYAKLLTCATSSRSSVSTMSSFVYAEGLAMGPDSRGRRAGCGEPGHRQARSLIVFGSLTHAYSKEIRHEHCQSVFSNTQHSQSVAACWLHCFLVAGLGKISAYAGTASYMQAMGVPTALLPGVIALEVGGALALIVGWKTRLSALLLAGFFRAVGNDLPCRLRRFDPAGDVS